MAKTSYIILLLIVLTSCSITKQISRSASEDVLSNKALATAHVGISIYQPESGKYLYNYQGDHFFIPASNTKLPTCYAAMKYLEDSLVSAFINEYDTAIIVTPMGDPTFLNSEFRSHPLFDYLKKEKKSIYITDYHWKEDALGSGWSWNDYNESYMAERSPLPVYGNIIKWYQEKEASEPAVIYSIPEINWAVNFGTNDENKNFNVKRDLGANTFFLQEGKEKKKEQDVPFITNGVQSAIELLKDTLQKKISFSSTLTLSAKDDVMIRYAFRKVYSQPTDSLLKPMMHRSDNFFAEQVLLMVSNKLCGVMSDEKIIDTLLKTDFKDLPQKPRWVDGSGLSRYNLFTPQDFVAILNKMKTEFGMERIKVILPTGGEGTISSYYKTETGYIFGKTGTLSGVVAFSGFLYTKKGKLLIFSTLVNNHNASATDIRKAIEKFLKGIREKF